MTGIMCVASVRRRPMSVDRKGAQPCLTTMKSVNIELLGMMMKPQQSPGAWASNSRKSAFSTPMPCFWQKEVMASRSGDVV